MDAEGDAVSYTCFYDTTVNGVVALTQACSTLPNDAYSFNAATGVLTWTPSSAATADAATRTQYEFRVVGTDSTALSSSVIFTIAVIRPWSQTLGFDPGTSASYQFTSAHIDFSGGYARLQTIDTLDSDGTALGFGGASGLGASWDGTHTNSLRFGSNGGCDGRTKNCITSKYTGGWMFSFESYATHSLDFENNFTGTVDLGDSQPEFQTGKIGSSSAYFSGDDSLSLNRVVSGNIFISFWMKSTQTYSEGDCTNFYEGAALVSADVPGVADDFGISLCDGYILAGTGNPERTAKSTMRVNDGQWHMITFYRVMSSGNLYLFVDGTVVTLSLAASTAPLTASTYIHLGADSDRNKRYVGHMDDLSILASYIGVQAVYDLYRMQSAARGAVAYSRIMDATQNSPWTSMNWQPKLPYGKELPEFDAAIRNENSTDYPDLSTNTLMNGIAGLWSFNGSSSAPVPDESGAGNNATYTGAGGSAGTIGVLSKAFKLAGTSYFDLGTADNLSFGTAGSFSASAWIKTAGTNSRIFSNGITSNSNGWMIRNRDGYLALGIGCNGGSTTDCLSMRGTTYIADDKWHHIAVTVDHATKRARLYVDGKQESLIANTACGANVGNDLNITACTLINTNRSHSVAVIGTWNGTDQMFDGHIDEMAIWNRNLNADEIKQLYLRVELRVGFQVRTCANSTCAGASWKGPDGTPYTYFSETNNNSNVTGSGLSKTTAPNMNFPDFAAGGLSLPNTRYFQYRYFLTSNDTHDSCTYGGTPGACSPELIDVSIGPSPRYASVNAISILTPIPFYNLNSFTETHGPAGCPGGTTYVLSLNRINWFYWNGTAWSQYNGTVAQSSPASDIQTNAPLFATQVGRGSLYIAAFLNSNGLQPCELDRWDVSGNVSH